MSLYRYEYVSKLPITRRKFSAILFFAALGSTIGCRRIKLKQSTKCLAGTEKSIELNRKADGELIFRVKEMGRWGFIDKNGNLVVEPKYVFSTPFSEGISLNKTTNGKLQLLNLSGTIIAENELDFTYIGQLHEGMASIKIDDRWGFVDSNASLVIQPQFKRAYNFDEGYSEVELNTGKWSFIDLNGRFITGLTFRGVSPFSEGLAAFYGSSDGTDVGFLTGSGEIDFEVDNIYLDFLAGVQYKNGYVSAGTLTKPYLLKHLFMPNSWGYRDWGYLDRNGQFIYETDIYFPLDNCRFRFFDGSKYGVKNGANDWIADPVFEFVDLYVEDVSVVRISNRYGYMGLDGGFISSPNFLQANRFSEGVAAVQFSDTGKWGFIEKDGKVLLHGKFDSASDFNGGLSRVEFDGEWGYLDKSGKIVWSTKQA